MQPTPKPIAVIADDDDQVRWLMGSFAGMQGYDVEKFNNPADALERLRDASKPRPTLLICDNDMPTTDQGIALIRHVREDESGNQSLTPLAIVLTSGNEISGANTDLVSQAGIFNAVFVQKPALPTQNVINNANALVGRGGTGKARGQTL